MVFDIFRISKKHKKMKKKSIQQLPPNMSNICNKMIPNMSNKYIKK